MDAALEILDPLVLDHVYAYLVPSVAATGNATGTYATQPSGAVHSDSRFALQGDDLSFGSAWSRDNIVRQTISILVITQIGASALYFICSALSYYFIFDRRLEHHPRFLKNQVRQEIATSFKAIPVINVLTMPWFLGEVRGKSFLYSNIDDYGWAWMGISTVLFMVWNDFFVYWIHRLEHHPSIYKYIHKPHHKWIMLIVLVPTPFASFAFHPLDGYAQSLPYHAFVFVFPLQKFLYLSLFIVIQVWTVLIHDGDMINGHWLETFVNSPAHHTLHHLYFNVNYGQYFTWADNFFDSHRAPEAEADPLHDALKAMREKGLIDENGNPIPETKKDQ